MGPRRSEGFVTHHAAVPSCADMRLHTAKGVVSCKKVEEEEEEEVLREVK